MLYICNQKTHVLQVVIIPALVSFNEVEVQE